jgi:hypothetical protein
MKLIESKTLTANAANIVFTSIPQTFTDLYLLASIRSSVSQADDTLDLMFNGSDSDRTVIAVYGTGSASSSGLTTNQWDGWATAGNTTSNNFSNISYHISNYTSSNPKSYLIDSTAENNATFSLMAFVGGVWAGTNPVNSLTIRSHQGGSLITGSSISLYGITKGSDGIVTTSP